MVTIPDNYKDSVAIVVVGYNRLASLQRLFNSLLIADYPQSSVPLVISIDASHDYPLYDYVKHFRWPYGELFINIQEKRLGLKDHIIQCGDLTSCFRGIVLLEDDLFVSNYFYKYALAALSFYSEESRIAEISLYKNEVNGSIQMPKLFLCDGSDSFLSQSVVSWGQCWSRQMWSSFRDWLDKNGDIDWDKINIPQYMKSWNKAWSKFFNAYITETNKYVLMPSVSFTTNFSDVGENSSSFSCLGQVNLFCGEKSFYFKDFDSLIKYDIYGYCQEIYSWIGLSKEELFIDLWGHSTYKGQPYVLCTNRIKGAVPEASYGLQMRPIELNIRYKIPGEGIFLYKVSNYKFCYRKPLSLAFYYIRCFDNNLLLRYLWSRIKSSVYGRIRSIFK